MLSTFLFCSQLIALLIPGEYCCNRTTELLNQIHVTYDPRIANGQPANLGDIPYQIAMRRKAGKNKQYKTFCGGSLIGVRKVLTAAHCFMQKPKYYCSTPGIVPNRVLRGKMAVAGTLLNKDYMTSTSARRGQWRKFKKMTYPEKYKFPDTRHDIAVGITNEPYSINAYVAPIPINTKIKNYYGLCLISGYGQDEENMDSKVLLFGFIMILPQEVCAEIYGESMQKSFCGVYNQSEIRKGDSGGPLVCTESGDPNEISNGTLVGVATARTTWCPRSLIPPISLYTRISEYVDLIENRAADMHDVSIIGALLFSFML